MKESQPSLAEFFSQVYVPRRLPLGSTFTLKKHRQTHRNFAAYLGREPLLSDLTEDTIARFIATFAVGHSAATISIQRNNLAALASYAYRRGLLAAAPEIPPIRMPRKVPSTFTLDEIARAVEATGAVSGESCGVPLSLLFKGLFLVAYDTGARARSRAMWLLEWRDIRPSIPALLFRAENQKQRNDQLLRVSWQTAYALEDIRQPERQFVFPWDRAECQKYAWIKKIMAIAGLPNGRHDLLQKFRRTTATMMYRAGGNATTQLGHASEAVTRRYYLDTSADLQAADILPRPTIADSRQALLF